MKERKYQMTRIRKLGVICLVFSAMIFGEIATAAGQSGVKFANINAWRYGYAEDGPFAGCEIYKEERGVFADPLASDEAGLTSALSCSFVQVWEGVTVGTLNARETQLIDYSVFLSGIEDSCEPSGIKFSSGQSSNEGRYTWDLLNNYERMDDQGCLAGLGRLHKTSRLLGTLGTGGVRVAHHDGSAGF